MKAVVIRFAIITLTVFTSIVSGFGESARMGWQTTTGRGAHISEVHMVGPTAQNKIPEKNGVFKGEFRLPGDGLQSKLAAIYKFSLDKNDEPRSQKLAFTVSPTSDTTRVKTQFETESISFEETDFFVLIFKTEVNGETKDRVETVVLSIGPVFVPSK